MRFVLSVLFVVTLPWTVAAENPNSSLAKALISSGKSLEREDKLLEARDKYAAAVQMSAGVGSKELAQINKKIATRTSKLLKLGKDTIHSKNYDKAVDELEHALKYSPGSAEVNCELGEAYHLAGDDTKAIDSLNICVSKNLKPNEKERFQKIISEIQANQPQAKPAKAGDAQKALTAFNSGVKVSEETLTTPDEDAQLCRMLLDNKEGITKTPAVLFNLAKCSEDRGNLEDAARYFSEYLTAAPADAAVPQAKEVSAQLQPVLAFGGEKRDEIRSHYRRAAQYLAHGRYSVALEEYETVARIEPNYAYGRRQLGLFYEALGRTVDASRELTAYSAMKSISTEERAWALSEIESLPGKRARYDAAVHAGTDKVRPMLFTGASQGVEADCDAAVSSFRAATDEFPLGPEANRMLGFLFVETGYGAGAKRAYDAARASSIDPVFFAWTNSKPTEFSLVRVRRDGLQIEPLYGPAKHKKEHKAKKSKKQHAANEVQQSTSSPSIPGVSPDVDHKSCYSLMESLDLSLPQSECGRFVAADDMKHIESKQGGIEITTRHKTIWLRPVNLFEADPVQSAPAGRKFANQYVRVIQRYMDNDVSRLGAEHMTRKEKAGAVAMFAGLAFMAVGGAMNGANSAAAAESVGMATMWAAQLAQKYSADRARMAQLDKHKSVPFDPAPLAFRVE